MNYRKQGRVRENKQKDYLSVAGMPWGRSGVCLATRRLTGGRSGSALQGRPQPVGNPRTANFKTSIVVQVPRRERLKNNECVVVHYVDCGSGSGVEKPSWNTEGSQFDPGLPQVSVEESLSKTLNP